MATHCTLRVAAGPPHGRRVTRPRYAALVLLGMLTIGAGKISAQQAGGNTADPPSPGLDSEPLVVESLGLEMRPPAGARVQIQHTDRGVSASVVDGAEIPTWSMRIQNMASTESAPTPAGEIAQLLRSWDDRGREYSVLDNDPIDCAGRNAQLCYARHKTLGGQTVIGGWLVVPAGQREFLAITLQMMPEHFERVRPILESSFSTIRLRNVEEIVGRRKARLDAGLALLQTMTPERLRSLQGPGRWYRYFRPAAVSTTGADVELGCMYVQFTEAARGAIKPDRPIENYDPEDHEPGLMAAIRGQLIDVEAQTVIDSIALYWMAWDQSEERWSVTVTTRQGRRTQSAVQTGIRRARSTSEPAGAITVIDSGGSGTTRDEAHWSTPEVYLSQPLRWALGRLLPRDAAQPAVYSWYCFDGATTSLSMRIDDWRPANGNSGGGTLTSRPRSDAEPIITEYDGQGEMTRRTWPDGSVNEAISAEDLRRLWWTKGLNTEFLDQ